MFPCIVRVHASLIYYCINYCGMTFHEEDHGCDKWRNFIGLLLKFLVAHVRHTYFYVIQNYTLILPF